MAVTRHALTHLDHTTATVNVGSNLSISPSVKVYIALSEHSTCVLKY